MDVIGIDRPSSSFRKTFHHANNGMDVTSEIESRLGADIKSQQSNESSDDSSIEEIWQVDGTIKVFLQYVGRVPYLFIDGDIDYRLPVVLDPVQPGEQRLVSIPYQQRRRVISTQLHYFDHPMFGMLIEIRRYKVP